MAAMRANWSRRFSPSLAILLLAVNTAWADLPPPLVKRLDGQTRAKVLAALAGLIILGFAMVLLTWLGGRFVQRYRQGSAVFRPTPRPGEHDWARKPLVNGDSEPDSAAADP
jgi:hypothetical protein